MQYLLVRPRLKKVILFYFSFQKKDVTSIKKGASLFRFGLVIYIFSVITIKRKTEQFSPSEVR